MSNTREDRLQELNYELDVIQIRSKRFKEVLDQKKIELNWLTSLIDREIQISLSIEDEIMALLHTKSSWDSNIRYASIVIYYRVEKRKDVICVIHL